jgi:hypothetical protein
MPRAGVVGRDRQRTEVRAPQCGDGIVRAEDDVRAEGAKKTAQQPRYPLPRARRCSTPDPEGASSPPRGWAGTRPWPVQGARACLQYLPFGPRVATKIAQGLVVIFLQPRVSSREPRKHPARVPSRWFCDTCTLDSFWAVCAMTCAIDTSHRPDGRACGRRIAPPTPIHAESVGFDPVAALLPRCHRDIDTGGDLFQCQGNKSGHIPGFGRGNCLAR